MGCLRKDSSIIFQIQFSYRFSAFFRILIGILCFFLPFCVLFIIFYGIWCLFYVIVIVILFQITFINNSFEIIKICGIKHILIIVIIKLAILLNLLHFTITLSYQIFSKVDLSFRNWSKFQIIMPYKALYHLVPITFFCSIVNFTVIIRYSLYIFFSLFIRIIII